MQGRVHQLVTQCQMINSEKTHKSNLTQTEQVICCNIYIYIHMHIYVHTYIHISYTHVTMKRGHELKRVRSI